MLGERATIYGFLARNRAEAHGSAEDTWSAYEAARTAIRKAVSVTSALGGASVGFAAGDRGRPGVFRVLGTITPKEHPCRADI